MKNVLITGTSSGIGLELLKIYSKNGFRIISLSRSSVNIDKFGLKNVNHIKFDISNNQNIDSLIELVELIKKLLTVFNFFLKINLLKILVRFSRV